MAGLSSSLSGIWLPLITPFAGGEVDATSLARLVAHFTTDAIDGFILAATTGEGLVLDDAETEHVVAVAAQAVDARKPVFLGLCGSDTRRLVRRLQATAAWPVDGYLITCPYYSRPSQDGMFRHFSALASVTDRPVLIYNIPYRTGVNLENDTLLRLAAAHRNIAGVKDCCADLTQSHDLLRRRRAGIQRPDRRGRVVLPAPWRPARMAESWRPPMPVRRPLPRCRCDRGGTPGRCARALESSHRSGASAVRRTQSRAHQALAVAARPDRLARASPADDRGQRCTGGPAGGLGCAMTAARRCDKRRDGSASLPGASRERAGCSRYTGRAVSARWFLSPRLAKETPPHALQGPGRPAADRHPPGA